MASFLSARGSPAWGARPRSPGWRCKPSFTQNQHGLSLGVSNGQGRTTSYLLVPVPLDRQKDGAWLMTAAWRLHRYLLSNAGSLVASTGVASLLGVSGQRRVHARRLRRANRLPAVVGRVAARMPERTAATQRATRRTVVTAGLANLSVMLIKVIAGTLTGSSAMLAEAAHSAADTLNQGFLLTSLKRSRKPADAEHPFGYGQERYFWSLLAAFGIFVAGAGFSVFEGILALGRSANSHDVVIAYAVLAAAALAEGISFARAYRQMRGEAKTRRTSLVDHVRTSPDTTVKAALFEDSVAVVGLALAAAGVGLRQLTGSGVWDGTASIAIGVLLVLVAIRLGLDSRNLLIGRAADPKELAVIRHEIETTPGVTDLIDLQTMHLGPDHLIVGARVSLTDGIDADDAENLADRIDRRLAEILPQTPHVFIDPTQQGEPVGPERRRQR